MDEIRKEILHGDDILPCIYELPSDLFDCLVTHLPPLALQNLQELPFNNQDDHESDIDCFRNCRKRKRYVDFETAWRRLYNSRWPGPVRQNQPVDWLANQGVTNNDSTSDWQQMYWETHLQNCLDEAAEIALLPSFDGCIGEIKIPVAIIKSIGYEEHASHLTCDYSKLSYHCQKFGFYTRCLRLQNVLCTAETCNLLRNSRLQGLELRWIKSKEHVEGLCKFLNQNSETLTSLEFIHCKLSATFVDAICDALHMKGLQTHGIQHFSIKISSFLETDTFSLPDGLASFLSSGRHLSSLSFYLSENNIAGWLFHFKWRSSSCSQSSVGIGKSLQSLRVLNLRGNNLDKDDVDSLAYALVYMPNLEILDISDNPIEDDGIRSLIPYFVEMSRRQSHFAGLKLENNDLGSKVGAPLGKILGTGIQVLDIEDIGLGSSGFLEIRKEIMEELKLVYINISKNRGGTETAKFLSKLISHAPDLIVVNAAYSFMPVVSLSIICSALKVAKGKLEQLDLTGNNWCDQPVNASVLAEFQINGKPIVILPSLPASNAPYDDDP
ncbi:hypothetical protein F0562_002350 [Nyssa sinensis]|uniref:Uncharacterized protein n=1 Tax=Nyssa sinensis TaxID=561372 RepID=A0A5J5C6Q8_9ASTE|nr:hypothetical protein F0562_002350 [Nyssa sinensis]